MSYRLARSIVFAGLLGLGLLAGAQAADIGASTTLDYPPTRTVDQVDDYHGVRIADPYRWLEDDNSAETRAWVEAQNTLTRRVLDALPQREVARRLYTALYDFEKVEVPFKQGGRYFWVSKAGLQPQGVLYTARSLNGTPQVALDPNGLSSDGTVALTGTVPSHDARLLAYGTASGGSDWQTWRVRDLATGRDLDDEVRWVKFAKAEWTHDGRGFFYARFDEPAEGAALSGINRFHKLYYHRIGTPQSADALVFHNPAEPDWNFDASVSADGRMLQILIAKTAGKNNALMVLPLPGGRYRGGRPQTVTLDFDAEATPLAWVAGRLVLKTDRGADRGRIVSVDLRRPAPSNWKTLVPEGPDAMTDAVAVGGRFVLQYLRDAASLVRVHAVDGRLLHEVALPGVGSVADLGGQWGDAEAFFSFTNQVTPAEIHRLDVASGRLALFKRPRTDFDPDQFESLRAFATTKDGTRVPVFIAHRKGLVLDGRQPTLLTGYGGFNISMSPYYSVTGATWMKMGGVFVIAVLRGGGEYGAAWYEAGTKLRKQNVFDDFIAAAEWLVARRYTAPDKLAITGGSNGGLLVGAVVNQRPELFGAAVPDVGVMDMLRFHKFTIGAAWTGDYGSSDVAEEFHALRAYSPLHNIRSGVRYPPLLASTADHDDRVVPAHSFKYIATLQAADTGPAPKLIRIDTRAGHGAGMPTAKLIEQRADMLGFMANALGMDLR